MRGEGLRFCLDCCQPINWVQTTRGYMVPIDPEHLKTGTWRLLTGTRRPFSTCGTTCAPKNKRDSNVNDGNYCHGGNYHD